VTQEGNPLAPSLLSFEDFTASVLVPALPRTTSITLRQVDATTITPLLGTHRLIGIPLNLLATQNNQSLRELDTNAVIDIKVPGDGAIPSNLGLYFFNEEHRTWVRVLGDFQGATRAFVGNTTHLGLYALLIDATPPAMLTGITATSRGRDITLTGTAEPLATIHLFAGNQFIGAFSANLQGRYNFTSLFSVGRHVITLRQIDQAGNAGSQSIEVSVTADWAVNIALVPGSSQSVVNNQAVVLDVPPRIINGRTMVPLRFITEALGASVTWQEATNSVLIQLGDKRVSLTVGSRTAMVDGVAVTLDVAPLVERGRTLVPVRFIAETFDCEVIWHSVTNRIEIRR